MFYTFTTTMSKQVSPSKESNVKLSIVIPTLHQDHYYEDVIQNLTDLGYGPENQEVEIITIEHKLVNEAWNVGVAKSKGEYILIINDDIIISKGTIEKLISLADYHKVSCPYFTRADNNQKVYSSTGKKIIGFCFMIRKDKTEGLFPIPADLKLRYGDDWLFWKADADMGIGGKIHHRESKTILGKEHKEKCDRIIEWDKYAWESFYKLICK